MEIEASEKVCPICQYEFPRQAKGNVWIAVILIIAFALWIIL